MHLKVKRGLNIPMKGEPNDSIRKLSFPTYAALDLNPFDTLRFKILVNPGDSVLIGQPLAYDKACPQRMFVSPASGRVKEIRRGMKRRLLSLVIDCDETPSFYEHALIDLKNTNRQELVDHLCKAGLFAHIRMRPFNLLADPQNAPQHIFVKALESAPFSPPAEIQVEGHEDDFATGLQALKRLTDGQVHLVYRAETSFSPFINAEGVEKHTVSGPHPSSNPSVHIHHIAPIQSIETHHWTLTAQDTVVLGHLLRAGQYWPHRTIALAGEGIHPQDRGYYKTTAGYPIHQLIDKRLSVEESTLISGNPLTGKRVEREDFLGFSDNVVAAILPPKKRQFLHFLRPGLNRYSATRTYPSGHIAPGKKKWSFTTSLHGEERAFIDGKIYDKVMPMRILTMPLVKALIAEDWDQAQFLGALEVDEEDFALPTFLSPSKVEMCQIVREKLQKLAEETIL